MLGRFLVLQGLVDGAWWQPSAGFVELGSLYECLIVHALSITIPLSRQSTEHTALLQAQGLAGDTRLYVIYVYPEVTDEFNGEASSSTHPSVVNHVGNDMISCLLTFLEEQFPADIEGLRVLYLSGHGAGYVGHRTIHYLRAIAMKLGFSWTEAGHVSLTTLSLQCQFSITLSDMAEALQKGPCPKFYPSTLKNKRTQWNQLLDAIHKGDAYPNLLDSQVADLNNLKSINGDHPTPVVAKMAANRSGRWLNAFWCQLAVRSRIFTLICAIV
ncbi:hypothetical protein BDN72DRAFT_861768 [Pluteus cervinus]|uniref:Uncharacterized protein n=1 Tax=Pluteus cervinus TaxID=181527 RepID=A0ACD3ADZ0_9AGAR|nr:hypothetical protein BDN72DRAFT_861768 [Pluteus cervinus]